VGFGQGGIARMNACGLRTMRRSGFTLLELLVAIVIMAILTAALLKSLHFYQAQVERAAAQQVVVALRSALHLQVLELIAQGRQSELVSLASQNPMDWMAVKPDNYKGEIYASVDGIIIAGNWYYFHSDKELIYFYSDYMPILNIFGSKLILMAKLDSVTSNVTLCQYDGDIISGVSLD
jgi:prepilin-type N-terminal cleavage/methylation domain-containing protein